MVNNVSPDLVLVGFAVGMAFSKAVRYELLKRDRWTCQNPDCVGNYFEQGNLNWRDGWNVNGAHYPHLHQKAEDKDMSHGRCLCVHCHILEEIDRGNHSGAGLLYEKQTIRNREWLGNHGWRDQKPPITWYYDWSRAESKEARLGLAEAYMDSFGIAPKETLPGLFDMDIYKVDSE